MEHLFSVSGSEFDELRKNGTVVLVRSYGTHWKKRFASEFGINVRGFKGVDETYETEAENPAVCTAKVGPTDSQAYVVLNSVRVYTDGNSGRVKLEITLTWSALNVCPNLAEEVLSFRSWLKEDVWAYAAAGLVIIALATILFKVWGN